MGKAGGSFWAWKSRSFFWGAGQRSVAPNVQGGVSRLDLRAEVDRHPEPAKDPLTPDVPIPDAFAGYIDPGLLEPALYRSPGARERLLQAVRASIVDIAAAIWFKLEFIIPICVQKWNF